MVCTFRTLGMSMMLASVVGALPAQAATVSLSGLVINSCTLATTNGTMVLATTGTELGSESGAGGLAATMTVLASGATPSLSFTAPVASVSGATAEIRYTHTGTAQAYTSDPSTSSAALIDTYTIHGRLRSASGFPTGSHTVTTTVTCQQAGS